MGKVAGKMANNDVYVVKMKQVYFTQECLNVFFYRQEVDSQTGENDAGGCFQAFNLDVLSAWEDMVNTSISITELEVFNIVSPTDNRVDTPSNSVGQRSIADNLRAPSWIAAGFKSNRAGPGSRSSFKRFAGLGEVDIDDNVISPAFVALQATIDLKAAMAGTIQTATGNSYQAVQVKSGWVLGVTPVTNFDIVSFIDPKLTSQVSRKP